LQDFDTWLRDRIKHQEPDEAEEDLLEEMRDKVREILSDKGLTLFD